MLRILGVSFGLAVIVGNTIGAGILRTPGEVASRLPLPLPFLLVWLAGGAFALLGVNAVAELGTMIPRSGGPYVFTARALGPYAGFVVGWSDWLSTCGTTAAVSLVIGEYSAALFSFDPRFTRLVASLVVLTVAAVQWKGIRRGSAVQQWTSLLKTLAFVLLIIACLALGRGGSASAGIAGETFTFGAWVIALQAVIYTYDGWSGIVYFSEEVEQPGRDIPRSMFGGLVLVIAIYLLVNAAFLHVVPIAALAGQPLAAGVVATALFGKTGEPVLRVLTILSMLSAVNAYQLMAPRVLLAMSLDGLVTERARVVNRGGTPVTALAASTVIAIAFLLTGTFGDVIAVLSFFFVAIYTLSYASLFVLRVTEPLTPRPFRAWGHPFTTALGLAASAAFLAGSIVSDFRNAAIAIALLVVSYPAFRLLRK